jgi:hypothetical protein
MMKKEPEEQVTVKIGFRLEDSRLEQQMTKPGSWRFPV